MTYDNSKEKPYGTNNIDKPQNELCNTVSFLQKKKNEEEVVLNTVLQNSRIVKSFSVKREDCNTLASFMEIARRERGSFEDKDGFSAAILRAMREYIEHHPIPNPQCTLDRSIITGLPARSVNQCCVPECKCKAKYLLTLRDIEDQHEKFQVCEDHFNAKWHHSRFKWLVCWKRL